MPWLHQQGASLYWLCHPMMHQVMHTNTHTLTKVNAAAAGWKDLRCVCGCGTLCRQAGGGGAEEKFHDEEDLRLDSISNSWRAKCVWPGGGAGRPRAGGRLFHLLIMSGSQAADVVSQGETCLTPVGFIPPQIHTDTLTNVFRSLSRIRSVSWSWTCWISCQPLKVRHGCLVKVIASACASPIPRGCACVFTCPHLRVDSSPSCSWLLLKTTATAWSTCLRSLLHR